MYNSLQQNNLFLLLTQDFIILCKNKIPFSFVKIKITIKCVIILLCSVSQMEEILLKGAFSFSHPYTCQKKNLHYYTFTWIIFTRKYVSTYLMRIKMFLKKSISIQAQIVCWCKMKKKNFIK